MITIRTEWYFIPANCKSYFTTPVCEIDPCIMLVKNLYNKQSCLRHMQLDHTTNRTEDFGLFVSGSCDYRQFILQKTINEQS